MRSHVHDLVPAQQPQQGPPCLSISLSLNPSQPLPFSILLRFLDKNENDKEDDVVEVDNAVSLAHDDLSVKHNSSLNDLSFLQPPQSRRDLGRREKEKISHIYAQAAGLVSQEHIKNTPGSPKRWREFDDILADQEGGGIHGRESLGDVDVEGNEGGSGNNALHRRLHAVLDKQPESTDKKRALSKRRNGLVCVRSVPQLDAEEPTVEGAVLRYTGQA